MLANWFGSFLQVFHCAPWPRLIAHSLRSILYTFIQSSVRFNISAHSVRLAMRLSTAGVLWLSQFPKQQLSKRPHNHRTQRRNKLGNRIVSIKRITVAMNSIRRPARRWLSCGAIRCHANTYAHSQAHNVVVCVLASWP